MATTANYNGSALLDAMAPRVEYRAFQDGRLPNITCWVGFPVRGRRRLGAGDKYEVIGLPSMDCARLSTKPVVNMPAVPTRWNILLSKRDAAWLTPYKLGAVYDTINRTLVYTLHRGPYTRGDTGRIIISVVPML